VSAERPVQFGRRDDIASLFRDSIRLYVRHIGVWVAIGAAVAVPVDLIVSGVGLGRLSGPYDPTPSLGALTVDVGASLFVSGPLVAAMVVHAALTLRDGGRPRASAAIQAGLDAFPRVLPPVLAGALFTAGGLVAFVVPGIYLGVRWYFVPQAVLVDRQTGVRAGLEGSSRAVRGSWWRAFTVGVLSLVVISLPALLLGRPFEAWAEASESAAPSLVGEIVVESVVAPFTAIVATLLYFDLRERSAAS
jgi:hypothetical protein